MRNDIVLLSDTASRENAASLATYGRALGLWRIPYRVVDAATVQAQDLATAAVVVAEDVHHLPSGAASALVHFVRGGGSLILGGLIGIEAAGALPGPIATLTGVAGLRLRESGPAYRVPVVAEKADWLAPWDSGVVLFFHNPAYATVAPGRDFDVALSPGARVIPMRC